VSIHHTVKAFGNFGQILLAKHLGCNINCCRMLRAQIARERERERERERKREREKERKAIN
jgi:hypothetical protein